MGSGIGIAALRNKHDVIITDQSTEALAKSEQMVHQFFDQSVQKQKMTAGEATECISRIRFHNAIDRIAGCDLVIEAIVENIEIKRKVFAEIEKYVGQHAAIATNTSSLSVTGIAAACRHPERIAGLHFFNPAQIMPLVEVIPALQTDKSLIESLRQLMISWGKVPVIAKDTPGFIVNRLARPYYGEALRIYEEQLASMEEIDEAMKRIGFKMGPFELMDLIGNDVNYAVTTSVFEAMYYDARYKPSITQKRMVDAGWLGRKSGRGYYNYSSITPEKTSVILSDEKQKQIADRILCMLFNEAREALRLGIASAEDLDLAMTKGVNYPKGLIAWLNEYSIERFESVMNGLMQAYQEERYRIFKNR